jgi:hypothetical protein
MTNRQENTYSMMKTTHENVEQNCTNDGMPTMLKTVNDLFGEKLREIAIKDQEKGVLTRGKTHVKRQSSKKLIESVMIISGAMMTYAVINNNLELQALSNIKKSYLKKERDTELAQRAEQIATAAQEHINKLAEYGITSDHLSELQGQITAYRSAMDDQESSMASRVSVRATVITLFQEADNILKLQLDPLMETVKPLNIEFYNAYKAARVIKDLRGGGRKQAAAAVLEESATASTSQY